MMSYHWHNIQFERSILIDLNRNNLQLLFIFHPGGDVCGHFEGSFRAFSRAVKLSGPGWLFLLHTTSL